MYIFDPNTPSENIKDVPKEFRTEKNKNYLHLPPNETKQFL
jgi:hypothetical protein